MNLTRPEELGRADAVSPTSQYPPRYCNSTIVVTWRAGLVGEVGEVGGGGWWVR